MKFIETMEMLRVQGPKNKILAVGDYLRADGPFEGKNDNFDPVNTMTPPVSDVDAVKPL
jgi:hypothetical protein